MPLRLLPWAPEYGTSMQFDAETGDDSTTDADPTVEGIDWNVVTPTGDRPAALQIIDGVRRAEAHAMDESPEGAPLFGLFGSLAVGAVRLDADGARILEEHVSVERRYFQVGGDPVDREVAVGDDALRFAAEVPPRATTANELVDALNRKMLDQEAKLAEDLSADESVLTLVDGPLRDIRPSGKRVVGYVKRIHNWYIDGERLRLLATLRAGQRSPLVMLRGTDGRERYTWFVRIADLSARYHQLGGIMRLEAPGFAPLSEAIALANQSTLELPRLASSPVRDPRAPHNLTPVGALEAVLTHRLGDRRWLRRLLVASVGEGADAVAAATALIHGQTLPEGA